ncbi:NAD(P)H-dependent oxidoreductase [Paludicola sp. MB14-C6]|uniref:flavodoxin family protein n=1 Tax=Paludihabitans sp. MB14-C6 TaxID=3070656 RepID=UPI0027DDF85E|nr:NAD(P)H-dependent oxidoreductase [Paludicola sp. MB14-C6]WMJ22986.1 NAD(P)H-dependent oxidoreductase [Paludicola sp. MB14-C6]
MKILLISGTNHKGSTYHIGRILVNELGAKEDEVKEVFLPKDMPKYCCGCARCFMEDEAKCPHYAYMKPITDSIDEADVLIFTSPVYVYHVTGQMKSLLDHYGYRWMVHRPSEKMFSKQAVCISTAAGGGMKSTNKDIKDSLKFWGVGRILTYGKGVAAISWDGVSDKKKKSIEITIKQIAKKIKKREKNVKPSLKVKMMFYIMRLMEKRGGFNPVDYEYWKAKGWLEKKRPWKNSNN